MSVSFNEFNSFYEELRQIVKEEVQEEIRLNEGFFDAAKGIFGGGAKHHTFDTSKQSQSSQRLAQAKDDTKIQSEYRDLVNKHPAMAKSLSLEKFKAVRKKMKDDEWKAAKQNVANIQRMADVEQGRSDRSRQAADRRGDLELKGK